MCFTRTDSGLAAEHHFYQETLVYVEGYSDIPFYDALLNRNYSKNKWKIKAAKNEKGGCKKFVGWLETYNYPYVVVLDGDYEILEDNQRWHSRVIILQRYSFESYLFEADPIKMIVNDYAKIPNNTEEPLTKEEFAEFLEKIKEKFMNLLVLDVARQRSEPKRSEKKSPSYFISPDKFYNNDFQDAQIRKQIEIAGKEIDEESINKAKDLVERYLKKHRLIDLLPGHFAFGIIRKFISNIVGKAISNDDIRILLSRIVWDKVETNDHDSLKKQLLDAVREAEEIRQNSI